MKITPAIAATILAYCAAVEAAPTPSWLTIPSLVPGSVRNGDVNGSKIPASLVGNEPALILPGTIIKPVNTRAERNKVELPRDLPNELRMPLYKLLHGIKNTTAENAEGLFGRDDKEVVENSEISSAGFLSDLLSGVPDLLGLIPNEVRGALKKTLDTVELPADIPVSVRSPVHAILDGFKRPSSSHQSSQSSGLIGSLSAPEEQNFDTSGFLGDLFTKVPDVVALLPQPVRSVLGEVFEKVEIPDSIPVPIREPVKEILNGLKKATHIAPSDKLAARSFEDIVQSSSDMEADTRKLTLPKRPQNPGTVSGLIDRRAEDHDVGEPEDIQERVRGHDRLNEAERLRQVQSMRLDNPSMQVRQEDIDRITEHMLSDALSNDEEEFCKLVGYFVKYYELEGDYQAMCKQKYEAFHALREHHKDDEAGWEDMVQGMSDAAIEFNHDEWIRIEHEDRVEIAENRLKELLAAQENKSIDPKEKEELAAKAKKLEEEIKAMKPTENGKGVERPKWQGRLEEMTTKLGF